MHVGGSLIFLIIVCAPTASMYIYVHPIRTWLCSSCLVRLPTGTVAAVAGTRRPRQLESRHAA